MDQILPRLYLGAFADVPQTSQEITRVVTLCERAPDTTLWLSHAPIPDGVFLEATIWQRLIELLSLLLDQGHTVLVHCRLGVSRSPALIAAYLVQAGYQKTLEEALIEVVRKRACVNVHAETWRGVQAWEEAKRGNL